MTDIMSLVRFHVQVSIGIYPMIVYVCLCKLCFQNSIYIYICVYEPERHVCISQCFASSRTKILKSGQPRPAQVALVEQVQLARTGAAFFLNEEKCIFLYVLVFYLMNSSCFAFVFSCFFMFFVAKCEMTMWFVEVFFASRFPKRNSFLEAERPGAPAKPMEKPRFSPPKNLVFRYQKEGF